MRYLLTIYGDESGWNDVTPEEASQIMAAYGAFGEAAQQAGVLTTDGPFAETREQLGGYYLLDCKDLDDAIGWAARIPAAQSGSVEVRPIMDYEAMGNEEAHTQTEGVA
jgi:hypothetical protein